MNRDRRHGYSTLMVSVVLASCSKTPPPSDLGSTLPLTATQAVPVQTLASAHPVESAEIPEPAAEPEVEQPIAKVRADAHSTSLEKNALMVALLPDWKPTADQERSDDQHPERADHVHVVLDEYEWDIYPSPWDVIKLDPLHAVLITQSSGGPGTAGGGDQLISAYSFTNEDGTWHLSKSECRAVGHSRAAAVWVQCGQMVGSPARISWKGLRRCFNGIDPRVTSEVTRIHLTQFSTGEIIFRPLKCGAHEAICALHNRHVDDVPADGALR
jgi:hypothetical protein